MGDSAIVVGISATYLVACLLIGFRAGGKTSASATGYVAGDRALGTLVMYFITGATIFSAFAFMGIPGWAYSRGVYALYVLGYGTLGLVPFYFLAPRSSRLGREYGFVTQAEMVAARFSSGSLAGLMAVISTIAFVPYLAVQMKGAGHVLYQMTEGAVPAEVGAAIVYSVVLVYVLKSGVLGVGWTNTFQGIFMMVFAWVMGIYLPTKLYGGIGEMFGEIAEKRPELLDAPGLKGDAKGSWAVYNGNVVASIIGFSFWPHLFMKAFSGKSEATLRRTVLLYPTFQIFLVPLIIIGFAGVMFESGPDEADQILPHLLMNIDISPVFVGLFCAGALAASMSSGDAILHASASIIVRDGIVTSGGKKLSPEAERRWIRGTLIFVLIASYILAVFYHEDIVSLLLYAYGPVTQLGPAVVATLYWRRATAAGVLSGLLCGIGINLACIANADLMPIATHAGLYGLAANVLVLALVSFLTRRPMGEAEERYLEVARTPGD